VGSIGCAMKIVSISGFRGVFMGSSEVKGEACKLIACRVVMVNPCGTLKKSST
jgi:hypothetical protein